MKRWLVAAGNVNSMHVYVVNMWSVTCCFNDENKKVGQLKGKGSKSRSNWVWSQVVTFVSVGWDESSLSFTVTYLLDVAGQLSVGPERKFPADSLGLFSGFDFRLWACFMNIFILVKVVAVHIFINHLKSWTISSTWAIWTCKDSVSNIWWGGCRHCCTSVAR